MFKNICINPNEQEFPTDIGFVAENLLYYEKVIFVASYHSLPVLINNCDIEILIDLVKNKNLKIVLPENTLGVPENTNSYGNTYYNVSLVRLAHLKKDEMVFKSIFNATGRRGHSKRISSKILDLIYPFEYGLEICDFVREDISERNYVIKSVLEILKYLNPDLSLTEKEILFDVKSTQEGLSIETNLHEINKKLKNPIEIPRVLMDLLMTRGDVYLASKFNSELATSKIQTELMKTKFSSIYNSIKKNFGEIYEFNDFVLSDGHAISEAINSGKKNFKDFMPILEKSEKFKNWLSQIDNDKNLLKEYYKVVTKETWIDKLSSKTFRWAFFSALGLTLSPDFIGITAGLGLSAADTFILDRIVKGWNPSIFVNNHLKKFVK